MSAIDIISKFAPQVLLGRIVTQLRTLGLGANAASQKMAATAFAIRVGNGGVVFLSQVLLARWMGASAFGTYVYVWTLLLVAADIVHIGLPLTAQRFVPEYRETGALALLRGYLHGSCWLTFGAATLASVAGAGIVYSAHSLMEPGLAGALYLACAALPCYALTYMADGIARSFNWIGVALLPAYVIRPLLFIGCIAALHLAGLAFDATLAMAAMAVAGWLVVIAQLVLLFVRLRTIVPGGARKYASRIWVLTSLPMALSWGLYNLLISTDVIVLKHFRSAEDVAHYYAGAKTVALIAIIYFAVAAATSHRLTAYAAADDRDGLTAFVASMVRWTFWPSFALGALLLAAGPVVLRLFGADFVTGYPVMAILICGHLVRASIGPAERILSMLGQQRVCVFVYAAALVFNIAASVTLVPRYGGVGAATATASAFMVETALLFWLANKRLGLHLFTWHSRSRDGFRKQN